jgi:hypothetical protein
MEKNKKILVELFIDENDQDNSLDLISFVSEPAIEKNFMYFNIDKDKYQFKATDTEKRIVTGPAMICNQEILRLDAQGNPYFVFFTEETIFKAQELFHKFGKTKSTNYEHEVGLRDVSVVESWIVVDSNNDKSNALGFKDIPKGSWMVSYKVDNDALWQMVKDGEVMGFSIEGVFGKKIVEMSAEDADTILYNKIQEIIENQAINDDDKYNIISKLIV